MKKNLNKIIIGVGLLLGFTSCDLDKVPLAALSPETYFSNEEELRLYSNRFYEDNIPSASTVYNDLGDAIMVTPINTGISGQRVVPATGGGWSWSALRRINYLLENSHQTEDVAVRNQYDALAKFFRAYFYFEKVKRFGDVPWFSDVLGSEDERLYKPRDSRVLIADSIMQDLDFAIEYLPTTKDVYRVNKWTALALKSRVALFEGTFRKYHGIDGAEAFLNICAEVSEELIDNGGYSLYTTGAQPYRDLFANSEAIGQEVILARDYDEGLNLIHNVQNFSNSSTLGRPGLTRHFVNTYLTSSGGRYTDLPDYDAQEFVQEMQNRDPRLAQTIRTPGYTRIGGGAAVPNLSFSVTGYHLVKYSMEASRDAYNMSISDIPIFRIAETYLNFAEAKAELGNLSQGDLDKSVNLIRARVGMPALNLETANANPDAYLSSEDTGFPNVSGANHGVILEIRRERGVELVMEGHRYYDIMRWKAGKLFEKPFLGMYFSRLGNFDLDGNGTMDLCLYEGTSTGCTANLSLEIGQDIVLSEGNSGHVVVHGNINRTFDEERDYFYPIPTEEINLSNGNLEQNPRW